MKLTWLIRRFLTFLLLILNLALYPVAKAQAPREAEPLQLIKPAASTGTGLLKQPPFDLSGFSTADFVALSSTIGANRIHKKWTSPVVNLPPPERTGMHGLTEREIKDYMAQARGLFDSGSAIPISDTGLIGTHEDVIRRPGLSAGSKDLDR